MKHSTGKWEAKAQMIWEILPSGYQYRRLAVVGHDWQTNLDEAEANAKVMAASSELLEKLKEAIANCPCTLSQRVSGHKSECLAPNWQLVVDKAEGKEEIPK